IFNICAIAPEYHTRRSAGLEARCGLPIAGQFLMLPAVQRRARSKRGRFVYIPHQLLEANRKIAALVLCEKPAHLTGAAMRLEHESAGVKRRQRGVECNPRPMPRKYCETMIPF